MEDLINKFKNLNNIKKINVREFCRQAHVSADTFYNFLKGENTTTKTLNKISRIIVDIESQADYQREEGKIIKEDLPLDLKNLLTDALEVLQSKTDYANALRMNIQAFRMAVRTHKEMSGSEAHPIPHGAEESG